MPTYIIQTTINPGVSYEVDQAEYEQLRDLGLLLNNNPTPLAGVFDTEVSALVQNVNSQTYLRLTQLPLQPHTHLTTEIADSGSTGRALLKTTSALDARTAIGALASTAAGAANGVATLDSGGKIPQSQLPAIALQEFLGTVGSQSAMLALTGQRGDWTTRTDLGTDWQLIAEPSTTLANWRERTYPASPVQSVDGRVGAVTLGTTAATANELARRGSTGTLIAATATQPTELTTLGQQTSAITAAGTVAATADTVARRGSSGTLLVATATQTGEATTLGQQTSAIAAGVAGGGWTTLPYANGATRLSTSFQEPQYRKVGNRVEFRGLVGTLPANGTPFAQMPVGFRPPADDVISVVTDTAPGNVYYYADGRIIRNQGTGSFITLANISYTVN